MKYSATRKFPRVEVRAVLRLPLLEGRSFAVRNVSLGGALIAIGEADRLHLPLGAVVDVSIFDPQNPSFGEIQTRARVVRLGRGAAALEWLGMSPKLLFDLDFLIGRTRNGSGR